MLAGRIKLQVNIYVTITGGYVTGVVLNSSNLKGWTSELQYIIYNQSFEKKSMLFGLSLIYQI